MKFKNRQEIQAIVKDLMGNLGKSHPGVTATLEDIREAAYDMMLDKYYKDIKLRIEDLHPNELAWMVEEIKKLEGVERIGGDTSKETQRQSG